MPTFMSRHYVRIAKIIKNRRERYMLDSPSDVTLQHLAYDFADMFAEDSKYFKRELFLAACEPTNREVAK